MLIHFAILKGMKNTKRNFQQTVMYWFAWVLLIGLVLALFAGL